MTSPHPLLCHSLVSISNGASHIEEDADEEEQGEEFEFDDIGPPERSSGSLMKSDWTTDTAVSNLYTKTNTAQETARQGMNGATITMQEGQHPSVCQQHCLDMEVRESPEGRSTSSDLGVTGESESFWKASSIYEVSPQTEHHTAEVDRPTNQSPVICSPDSVVRDPEVIYDDVPPENLQHPVEDVDGIYEDIQRPGHRGSNGWSSSEFESYDELSDSETVPPASSKVTHYRCLFNVNAKTSS
ncbi:rho guanine nucleotide exchange factor 10-like protein isoform X2 [Anarrhichthys ocellatus]|uniref:rho guanine nucleotide exchange factor 10-like protein isoform X2 n=1 Tax=Anarrhichthys ocellatus TaxID=433405 RepID=UPI0012EDD96D|nr:rho guanine nucleotide exchange factor 10-like protein isoform X2 [Anarrhichthys ocellatus]